VAKNGEKGQNSQPLSPGIDASAEAAGERLIAHQGARAVDF